MKAVFHIHYPVSLSYFIINFFSGCVLMDNVQVKMNFLIQMREKV